MALIGRNIFFGYELKEILSGLSFYNSLGEYIGITGINGSGKTTLSLVLAGVKKLWSGTLALDGISPFINDDYFKFRHRIGYVFQNPEDGFIASQINREIAFGAENAAFPSSEIENRVRHLLDLFGFESHCGCSSLELSGGMKARLAIASAIASGADYLILDEPEAFLDYRGKKSLSSAINEIAEKTGIVHITQNPDILSRCERKLLLKNGILKKIDGTDLISKVPSTEIETNPTGETVLAFENVSFDYMNINVFSGISFVLKKGEVVGLVGASGEGKSTAALLSLGILKPKTGRIFRSGRAGLAMQFPERQLFAYSLWEDVLYGPSSLGISDPQKHCKNALILLGLSEEMWKKSPFELSDGQQRRAGIAGVLAIEPDILILDEPFASLDYIGREKIFTIVRELVDRKVSIIIITHETDLLSKFATRLIALQAGKIAYDGPTNNLLNNNDLCDRLGIAPLRINS